MRVVNVDIVLSVICRIVDAFVGSHVSGNGSAVNFCGDDRRTRIVAQSSVGFPNNGSSISPASGVVLSATDDDASGDHKRARKASDQSQGLARPMHLATPAHHLDAHNSKLRGCSVLMATDIQLWHRGGCWRCSSLPTLEFYSK